MWSLWTHRRLLINQVRSDLSSQYRGSALGLVWPLITPALMLIMYATVFGVVFRGRFGVVTDESPLDYAFAIFCGLSLYYLISSALGRAATIIDSNRNYVKKVVFPLEILPASVLGTALFHYVLSMSVFIVALLYAQKGLHWTLLFLPLLVLANLLWAGVLTYLFAGLSVFVRDLRSLVEPVTMFLLFASAIFYPLSALPEAAQRVLFWNPFVHIFEQARGVTVYGQMPDWTVLAVLLASGGLAFVFAYRYFLALRPHFADYM